MAPSGNDGDKGVTDSIQLAALSLQQNTTVAHLQFNPRGSGSGLWRCEDKIRPTQVTMEEFKHAHYLDIFLVFLQLLVRPSEPNASGWNLLGNLNYLGLALPSPVLPFPTLPFLTLPCPGLACPGLPLRLFRLLYCFLLSLLREGEGFYFTLSWKECQKFILQAILKIIRQKLKIRDKVEGVI